MEGINFDVVEEKWLNTYPVLETMSELIFQPQLLEMSLILESGLSLSSMSVA